MSEGLGTVGHVTRVMEDQRTALIPIDRARELASNSASASRNLAYGAQNRRQTQVKHAHLGRGEHGRHMLPFRAIPGGVYRKS